MAYPDLKNMLKDARNFATGANDIQTVNILKDIHLGVYDLLDENRELRLELEELKRTRKKTEGIKKIGDFYYIPKDNDPICSKCWEVDQIIVHALEVGEWETFTCPNCQTNSFRTKKYIEENS